MRNDEYASHLKSVHILAAAASMRNTREFCDRPNKRHTSKGIADTSSEEADNIHLYGPQTRDDRINTTSFIWWNLNDPISRNSATLTCCLRCRRTPFYAADTNVITKNAFFRWIKAHVKAGCFNSIEEYRKDTMTTIRDITANRISLNVAAAVRKTETRLGVKRKTRVKKVNTVSENVNSGSENVISVSENVNSVSETDPKTETPRAENVSEAGLRMLRDYYGPVGEGETPPTTDELIEVVTEQATRYKAQNVKLRSGSTDASLIASLRSQIRTLQTQIEALQEAEEKQYGKILSLENELKYSR